MVGHPFSGKIKIKNMLKDLEVIEDAKAQVKIGPVAVVGKKKYPFMSDTRGL